jgi:hypothetical protein
VHAACIYIFMGKNNKTLLGSSLQQEMKEIPKHGHGNNTIRRDCYKARDKSLFCFPAYFLLVVLLFWGEGLWRPKKKKKKKKSNNTQRDLLANKGAMHEVTAIQLREDASAHVTRQLQRHAPLLLLLLLQSVPSSCVCCTSSSPSFSCHTIPVREICSCCGCSDLSLSLAVSLARSLTLFFS